MHRIEVHSLGWIDCGRVVRCPLLYPDVAHASALEESLTCAEDFAMPMHVPRSPTLNSPHSSAARPCWTRSQRCFKPFQTINPWCEGDPIMRDPVWLKVNLGCHGWHVNQSAGQIPRDQSRPVYKLCGVGGRADACKGTRHASVVSQSDKYKHGTLYIGLRKFTAPLHSDYYRDYNGKMRVVVHPHKVGQQ